MIVLALTLTAWALLHKYTRKPQKRRKMPIYAASMMPSAADLERQRKAQERAQRDAERAEKQRQRDEEKRRKAEQARQMAQMQLDHLEYIKTVYADQIAALEKERDEVTTKEKRREQINNKLLQLDEKMFNADMKIAQLYYKAQS